MTVTIKDVAKMSGVSISTVSRVLNESKPVSESIKERVFKVIEETGYVPNPVARSLVMKKSQLIGVVAPDLSEAMVGNFLNGIEEIARMYEYDTLICTTYNDKQKLNDYVNLLFSKQVAGIIFISSQIDEKINKKLIKQEVPAVYYTKAHENFDTINYVDIDKQKVFGELIDKVKNNGKLLFLAKEKQSLDFSDTSDEQVFEKHFKEKKIDYEIMRVPDDRDNCYRELENKLKKEKISSVISSSDEKTLALIYCAQDLGIDIPKDIKLAQLYETSMTKLVRPSVTAISIPYYDIGAICARMIVKQIDAKEKDTKASSEFGHMILGAKLIYRDSTK